VKVDIGMRNDETLKQLGRATAIPRI
jgi:hypothetical protein